jgi:hypothetical protein
MKDTNHGVGIQCHPHLRAFRRSFLALFLAFLSSGAGLLSSAGAPEASIGTTTPAMKRTMRPPDLGLLGGGTWGGKNL